MGHRELIESLHKEREETINLLWSKVKAEAEEINAETHRKIAALREKYQKEQEAAVKQEEASIISGIRNRARIIKLSAERALSERLYPLALSCLCKLRDARSRDVFSLLVKELPDSHWKDIRVNPQDLNIAQEHFPGSHCIPDENISGGLEVIREDGRVSIANTFEKRLEKAWEDLLPLLISSIYNEVSVYEPSSKP
ncbi:MAG: V-type ATP synthase subunit E [Nitrospiraceae bacterium]|nr:MAG: V-type ATP synthase subunit E [Nitrospiraceae bacterium]